MTARCKPSSGLRRLLATPMLVSSLAVAGPASADPAPVTVVYNPAESPMGSQSTDDMLPYASPAAAPTITAPPPSASPAASPIPTLDVPPPASPAPASGEPCGYCTAAIDGEPEFVFLPGSVVPPDYSRLTNEAVRELRDRVQTRLSIASPLMLNDPTLGQLDRFGDQYRSSALDESGKAPRNELFTKLAMLQQTATTASVKLTLAATRLRLITLDGRWLQEDVVMQALQRLVRDLRDMAADTANATRLTDIYAAIGDVRNRTLAVADSKAWSKVLADGLNPFTDGAVLNVFRLRWEEVVIGTGDPDTIRRKIAELGGVAPCEPPELRRLAWNKLNALTWSLGMFAQNPSIAEHTDNLQWIATSSLDLRGLHDVAVRAQLAMFRADPDFFTAEHLQMDTETARILTGDTLAQIEQILLSGVADPETAILPLMRRLTAWSLPWEYIGAIGDLLVAANNPELRRIAAIALGVMRSDHLPAEVIARLSEMLNDWSDEATQVAALVALRDARYTCSQLTESDRRLVFELMLSEAEQPLLQHYITTLGYFVENCGLLTVSNLPWLRNGLLTAVKRHLDDRSVLVRYRYREVFDLLDRVGYDWTRAKIDVPEVSDADRARRTLVLQMMSDLLEVDRNFVAKLIITRMLLAARPTAEDLQASAPVIRGDGLIGELNAITTHSGRIAQLSPENRQFYYDVFDRVTELRRRIEADWLRRTPPGTGADFSVSPELRSQLVGIAAADLMSDFDLGDLLRHLQVVL